MFFPDVVSRRDTAHTRAKRAQLDDAFARDEGSKMEEPYFSDFPPFSTPQGGEMGISQNVPLTANSIQIPVECVGILGGSGRYTLSGIQSAEK
jgi:hypothetical protein